jgi:RecA/RadA recombinase
VLDWCVCLLLGPLFFCLVSLVQAVGLLEDETDLWSTFSSGLEPLDAALGGGIRPGMITEVVGPSGVGKSQFCMSLVAHALLSTSSSVIVVDTEGKFSPSRLREILTGLGSESTDALSRVHLLRVSTSSELSSAVSGLDTSVMDLDANIVIIDSIAALARRDFDSSAVRERQSLLSEIATSLKRTAEVFKVAVVATNQVAGCFADGESYLGGSARPALGNTWAHCVNTRLLLEHFGGDDVARIVTIAKSPNAPSVGVAFAIGGSGVIATSRDVVAPSRFPSSSSSSLAIALGGEHLVAPEPAVDLSEFVTDAELVAALEQVTTSPAGRVL